MGSAPELLGAQRQRCGGKPSVRRPMNWSGHFEFKGRLLVQLMTSRPLQPQSVYRRGVTKPTVGSSPIVRNNDMSRRMFIFPGRCWRPVPEINEIQLPSKGLGIDAMY